MSENLLSVKRVKALLDRLSVGEKRFTPQKVFRSPTKEIYLYDPTYNNDKFVTGKEKGNMYF